MSNYYLGLDLGQAKDPSALVGIERICPDHVAHDAEAHYSLGLLQQWPLGTDYTEIARAVGALVNRPMLQGCALVVDYTGVGRPWVDMIRKEKWPCRIKPVLITGGHATSLADDGSYHVAKRELVSVLHMVMSTGRFKIRKGVPHVDKLVKELRNFTAKITLAGNETFEAWRDNLHDDICLGCAIAVYIAERHGGPYRPPQFLQARKLEQPHQRGPGLFGSGRKHPLSGCPDTGYSSESGNGHKGGGT